MLFLRAVAAVVAQDPNEEIVLCYASDDCSGDPVSDGDIQVFTRGACCDNQVDPVGYSTYNSEVCQRCPIG